jgi:hypothetical protein
MYERRADLLLSRAKFLRRLSKHALFATGLLAASLGIGVLGYRSFEGMPWLDALLNASMILGGMGPVDPLKSTNAKLFASFYALFSGVIFLGASGILLAPIVHRVLHQFHLDVTESDSRPREASRLPRVRAAMAADPSSRPPAQPD